MSQSIVTPPATTTLRAFVARMWDDPDARSTTVGLFGVVVFLIFWLLMWILDPPLFRHDYVPLARPVDKARDFDIELAADEVKAPAKPADPFKFVETNPEAPENTPDKTTNFAAQNQQVSQEKPTPDGKSDRPALEGKKDFESNQIVSGQLTKPIEFVPPAPPAVDVAQAETPVAAPKAQQIPLPGEEKFEGENKDGIGGSLAKRELNPRPVAERVEGTPDAQVTDSPAAQQFAIDPKRPRPRPMVTQTVQARPAILADNPRGTSRIGPTAVDARWSQYGTYLQRMIDTVQMQWDAIVSRLIANPATGSTVAVKFVLDAEGRIAQIVSVDTTANEPATRACISGITDRAPYGAWPDDMRAVLGERQEMTFTFHYQ